MKKNSVVRHERYASASNIDAVFRMWIEDDLLSIQLLPLLMLQS